MSTFAVRLALIRYAEALELDARSTGILPLYQRAEGVRDAIELLEALERDEAPLDIEPHMTAADLVVARGWEEV